MIELQKRLFYDSKENVMYMPNEIFDDFQKYIKPVHIPFAYSYYYLISWLYRYAKYGEYPFDNKDIKEILGYHATNKKLDYLIKTNGLLDEIGYTETVKNYPIEWKYDDGLDFTMFSELNADDQKIIQQTRSRKYFVKFPVKGIFRTQESLQEEIVDGTFYDLSNTHEVPFEVFLFCMSNKEINVTGFYLWSYLKMKNQHYEQGYDVSVEQLCNDIGMARRTLMKYLKVLKQYNMIQSIFNQEYYSVQLSKEERKANTYEINNFDLFSHKQEKIERMMYVG